MTSSSFNITTNHPRYEVQRIIEETILELNKCKANDSYFKHVYLIGGLDNGYYHRPSKLFPPLFCMAQYFGEEQQLHGGLRAIKPVIIYLFDFLLKQWYVFDRAPPNHAQSSDIRAMLNKFKHDSSDKASEVGSLCKLADYILDNVIENIKH
jgi:hypothetical protein